MLCCETVKQDCVHPTAHSLRSTCQHTASALQGSPPLQVCPARPEAALPWVGPLKPQRVAEKVSLATYRDCPLKTLFHSGASQRKHLTRSLYVPRGMKQISRAILEVRDMHFSLKYHGLLYIRWKDLSFGSIRVTHLECTSQSIRILAGL